MKLFGTDGIRGKAGDAPLNEETVVRVGAALVRGRESAGHTMRVLVGRDTRESGDWIERALARGLWGEGAEVTSAGILPTPAVAYLTRTGRFDAGIVISASHNPFEDNGIKVFSPSGEKLSELVERRVESIVADDSWTVGGLEHGPYAHDDMSRPYLDHARRILGDPGPLGGSHIVLDCANGATALIAPSFFRSLGFHVDAIGVEPDGRNINLNCGSTHLQPLQQPVVESGARMGVAFDGDGDRALFVDHTRHACRWRRRAADGRDRLKREGRLRATRSSPR